MPHADFVILLFPFLDHFMVRHPERYMVHFPITLRSEAVYRLVLRYRSILPDCSGNQKNVISVPGEPTSSAKKSVVSVYIILVHRLLHKAHAKHLCEELIVSHRIVRHCRHVVYAEQYASLYKQNEML